MTPSPPLSRKDPVIANLHFVTDRLATGGDLPYDHAEARRHVDDWQRLGITHVVDTRIEWSDAEQVAEWAPAIVYLHNPADDVGQKMPDSWFDTGVDFIHAALEAPDSKVFVHCHMGINRGPSLAYAALLDLGWDPVAAIKAIRTARSFAGVGYAEDALDWHHRRTRARPRVRDVERSRLELWREENWIDVVRIIRSIRDDEEQP